MSHKNHDNKKKRDDSYISINRRKRNKYLKIVGIPIGIAVIVLGVIVATQAQEHGLGAKIVYHIHPHLNMTVDGKPVTVPQGIGINSSLYKDHSLDKYSTPEIAPVTYPRSYRDYSRGIHCKSKLYFGSVTKHMGIGSE